MSQPRKIVLLGATGSIGDNTLKVIRRHPEKFELIGVAANRNAEALQTIGREFHVREISLFEDEGLQGLMRLATLPDADVIIIATTGTVGLKPTISALEAGKTVGLANKETLVLGGPFVMAASRKGSGRLLPVDSEHNAIFQCLEGLKDLSDLKRVILTASGGPFLHHTQRELEEVTLEAALKHPNWEMGPKVTIDSATMANKGLEMIEARWLFDLRPDQIEVVVHPQSIIHSMIELRDGSILAQMAPPSMTFPIQHVLAYPGKLDACMDGLDFSAIHRLELRPVDMDKFPCLRLAMESLHRGGTAPAIFNAANEVAVAAFVENKIGYLAIPKVIEHCLSKASFPEPDSLDELLQLEKELLAFAHRELNTLNT